MPNPLTQDDEDAIADLWRELERSPLDVEAIRRLIAKSASAIRAGLDPSSGPVFGAYVLNGPPHDQTSGNATLRLQLHEAGRKKRQAWCTVMQELLLVGLRLEQVSKNWVTAALQQSLDVPTVKFLLEQGLGATPRRDLNESREDGCNAAGLLWTMTTSSPEERMDVLPLLLRVGIVGGGTPLLGVTDFIGAQLMDVAEVLVKQGLPLETCRVSIHRTTDGFGPIETYLGNLATPQRQPRHRPSEETPAQRRLNQQEADVALDKLRQIVRWGGKIGDYKSVWGGRSFALAALLGVGVNESRRGVSQEMLETLGAEVLALGSAPNDGSALAYRLATMRFYESGEEADSPATRAWDWALAHGFEPSKHTSALLCVATRERDEDKAWSMIQHYVSSGVRIDALHPHEPSPVQRSLEDSRNTNAWKLVAAGAPLHYVDQKGEGVLHFLAERSGKGSLAQLERCLTHAPVVALIHQGSTENGHEGEQPLHRACAALNLGAIEQLFNAGASINAQDAEGWTPLRHALRKSGLKAQEKALPVIRWLLEHGADPSICDTKGRTPTQGAAAKAFLPALAELLRHRPEDVANDSKSATVAHNKLKNRGDEGRSLAEWGQLRHALTEEVSSITHTPPSGSSTPKKGRTGRRL